MIHKLEVLNIKKHIKKAQIVKNISLYIQSGETVGLLGPNGAGKTTTFYIISGLIEQNSGSIILDDEDISNLPLHSRASRGIGYLPQESSIFKDLSVEDNLMIAAEVNIKDKSKRRKKVRELLELFNIEPFRHRIGIQLSGGERRRVEIARALVNSPKFLLLDEPFAGVDPKAVFDMQKVINELTKLNIGILITDHSVRETLSVCDRSYVIKAGELIASGTSSEIEKNDVVREHYLGDNFKL